MLSEAENELITNTDRGTPMGELFRRFWLPVALTDDLPEPDGAPLRLKLLNEELVAFRDSDGGVGLIDAYCAHRGASLFFGRNEECGLRCIYHGWKYDRSGACVDLPNAPEGDALKQRIRIAAYPCVEAGGLVWTYMGPADKQPPFPLFEWTRLPASHRYAVRFRLECNYLQAMEGDFDPSHSAFLHMSLAERNQRAPQAGDNRLNVNNTAVGNFMLDRSAWGRLEDSGSGVLCLTDSREPDGRYFATANPLWLMPIFHAGAIAGTDLFSASIRVPIDNQSLMFFRLRWSYDSLPETEIEAYRSGGVFYPELLEASDMPRDNRANDYHQDREAQRRDSFSGIRSFPMQDAAMVENQRGPVTDRSREHLTSADEQIIHVRRRLLQAAKAMATGQEPAEPWRPEAYRYHYESAVAETRADAIAEAKRLATASRLPEPAPTQA